MRYVVLSAFAVPETHELMTALFMSQIPTSEMFGEVLVDSGFEQEATFAAMDKSLSDTRH